MNTQRQERSLFREWAEAIIIALLLALFIRTFVVQAFKIPSGSMLPTLKIGDHLLVNKFIYGVKLPFTGTTLIPWEEPTRGDVVVFRFPKDRSTDFIKRVVGTPGDTVTIRDKKVYINGKQVADPHAFFSKPLLQSPMIDYGPVTVPKGSLFVMGDNRDNSYDSRFWGFVKEQDVLGKAFILYWSWDPDTPFFSLSRLESIRWSRIGKIIH